LSKLPSKKKAMLRLSTYGKTSSDVRHNFAKLSSERSDVFGTVLSVLERSEQFLNRIPNSFHRTPNNPNPYETLLNKNCSGAFFVRVWDCLERVENCLEFCSETVRSILEPQPPLFLLLFHLKKTGLKNCPVTK
jgi:hypothetical protein